MKNLILDFANLAAITRFGAMAKDSSTLIMTDEEWVNYFLDTMLVSLSNYINVLKADRVILTIESRSWRKTYYPLYKANRDAGKEADPQLDLFYSDVNQAADFMNDFTNAKVIKASNSTFSHTVTFTGADTIHLANSSVTSITTLTSGGTGGYTGANLLGNPYPSSIDWDDYRIST